eukprot:23878-Chlamydomonas_euryale.AAC.5
MRERRTTRAGASAGAVDVLRSKSTQASARGNMTAHEDHEEGGGLAAGGEDQPAIQITINPILIGANETGNKEHRIGDQQQLAVLPRRAQAYTRKLHTIMIEQLYTSWTTRLWLQHHHQAEI